MAPQPRALIAAPKTASRAEGVKSHLRGANIAPDVVGHFDPCLSAVSPEGLKKWRDRDRGGIGIELALRPHMFAGLAEVVLDGLRADVHH